MDHPASESPDLIQAARAHVKTGPVPSWVAPCPYNADFTPIVRDRYTYLLIERQVHAELRQTFERNAFRLETIQAVQDASQWRREFEPKTQTVTLHSISLRRGSHTIEHLSLNLVQFLRREAGLEGFSIDGWITLLLVLEDVRPGDIIETSYTIEYRPRLLPDSTTSFFTLPAGPQIGKYHFSILHAPSRPLKWKSSSADLMPSIDQQGEEVRCVWLAEGKAFPEMEECLPSHSLPFPWIQVSDCSDWQMVALDLLKAWDEKPVSESFDKLLDEIKNCDPEISRRVNRAIELVQDEFRYLSVNLELGGQVPAPAETVVRRRYGDCKDLAFLLARLLRALGISARPVLVHSLWRRCIADMLPSPGIFNHAIVEFELQNEKRWVDCTMKCQGGGALGKWVQDFGLGLPLDTTTSELAPVPKSSLPSGSCEIKESFILDTAGNPSLLAVTLVLTGFYADDLRLQFASLGRDAVAKKRLQMCADKFSKATRVGQLEYRDERDLNQFVLAEVFDIDGFLLKDAVPNICFFRVQSDATVGFLPRPSPALRRNPFALPFPCNRVHIIEIDFQALGTIQLPHIQINNDFFRFSRRSKCLQKFLKLTFSLEIVREAVPPDSLDAHRKQVDSVWRAAALQLQLPAGYGRLRKSSSFGALPLPARSTSLEEMSLPVPSVLQPEKKSFIRPASPTSTLNPRRSWKRLSSRRSGRQFHIGRGAISLVTLLGALALFAVAAVLRNSSSGVALANLLFFFVVASMGASIVLAILSLRETRETPHSSHDRVFAWLSVGVGTFFALILTLAMLAGAKGDIRRASAGNAATAGLGELQFKSYNFVFRLPGPPWQLSDPRTVNRNTVLSFTRPGMNFTLIAVPLEPGYSDPRARVVELNKGFIQRDLVSTRFLSEGPISRNGIEGWHMEIAGHIQGRDIYLQSWIIAENGFGYALRVLGPLDLKNEIKSAADQMFSNFQLTK